MLQGVAFRGGQVLREKRFVSLHEKKGPENRKNEVKLRPPLCRPLKHSINYFGVPQAMRVEITQIFLSPQQTAGWTAQEILLIFLGMSALEGLEISVGGSRARKP